LIVINFNHTPMSNTTIYIQVNNYGEVLSARSYLNEKFDVVNSFSKEAGKNFKEGSYYYIKMEKDNNVFYLSFKEYNLAEKRIGDNVYKFENLSTIDESVFDDKYSKIKLGSQITIGHTKYTVCLNGRSCKYGLWNESVYSFFEDKSQTIEAYRLELKEKYGRVSNVIKY